MPKSRPNCSMRAGGADRRPDSLGRQQMAVLGDDRPAEGRAGTRWADEGLGRGIDQMRQNERRLRTLVEHAHDLLVITDVEGKPLFVSPSVRQIAGRNPAEVLG